LLAVPPLVPLAGTTPAFGPVLQGGGFDIWGLSRYAYVEGNPVVRTDPSGHYNAYDGQTDCSPCVQPASTSTSGLNVGAALQALSQLTSVHPENQYLVNGVQDALIQGGLGIENAAEHPLETAMNNYTCSQDISCLAGVAGSILDTKDLLDGNFSKWVGHETPMVLLIALTGGALGDAAPAAPEAVASSGTAWDSITATQETYAGTSMPRSMVITLEDGQQVWIHPNVTEHFVENIAGASSRPLADLAGQIQLANLRAVLSRADLTQLGDEQTVGNWELKMAQREGDQLPAVVHFLFGG
jgi:hypothetical protein